MTAFDVELEAAIAVLRAEYPSLYEALKHTMSAFKTYQASKSIRDYRVYDVVRDEFALEVLHAQVPTFPRRFEFGYEIALYLASVEKDKL